MGATIGDGTTPEYRFDWEDGSSRTTEDVPESPKVDRTEAVETLAHFGRQDPECDVTLTGFE